MRTTRFYHHAVMILVLAVMPAVTYETAFAGKNIKETLFMQNQAYADIHNRLSTFFRSVDERNWQQVLDIFDEKVFIDFSSFNGLDAATVTREDIVKGWSEFLPQFDATHHQIGNVDIRLYGKKASVKCYGTATHFKKAAKGGQTQQIIGTYNIAFIEKDGAWRISEITFNFAFRTGNPNLLETEKSL